MYNPPQITKNPEMPVVLIAGGAGFIGSHLTEYLLSQTFRVVVIDSLKTGRREAITHFTGHPRFAFMQFDLNQGIPGKVESVDYIVHLAAEELHLFDRSNTGVDSVLTAALATRNLLELAKNCSAKVLVTSSVNIYQGMVSSTSLNNYFGQGENEEKSFSFYESKRFAEGVAFEYYKKYNLDIRIARLGEVYGPGMDFKSTASLGRFIESILKGDNITIYGDGLEKEFYCYISDTVNGLSKTLFLQGTAGGIFPITDLNPITVLELAYVVKSFALPGTQIIFKPRFDDLELPAFKVADGKVQRELKWKPRVNLKDGLRLTLEYCEFNKITSLIGKGGNDATTGMLTENYIPPGKYERHNDRRNPFGLSKVNPAEILKRFSLKNVLTKNVAIPIILFLSTISLIGGFPLIKSVTHFTKAYIEFKTVGKNLRELKLEKAILNLYRLNQNLVASRNSLESVPYINNNGNLLKLLNSLSFYSQMALSATEGLAPLLEEYRNLDFFSSANKTLEEEIGASKMAGITESLVQATDFLNLALADFKKLEVSSFPSFLRPSVNRYGEALSKTKDWLKALTLIAKIAPDVLGIDGERNYLLIFQNSNELRPTGGFIGSLGKITFKKGRLVQTKIIDVYDVDGQIDEKQIRFTQPKFLSDNLKTEYLHLRDTNYTPSFPDSAQMILKLYREVNNEIVDGIIALDLTTLESLLRISGPVFLPTYNETVNEQNVFERTQFHSETSFFPGSTQKKTFLSILSQQLIDTLLTLNSKKHLDLLKESKTLLEEKHILLYLPGEQATVAQLGWDGRILNSSNDYVMVVDANVGANKSNFFIEKSIDYQLERSNREGEFLAELRITYGHRGTSDTWPGGPYKNHLRIYVPKKTSLLKVTFSEMDREEVLEITKNTNIGDEFGKTVFSTTLIIETGRTKSVVFSYVLPPSIIADSGSKYRLLIQKQPSGKNENFVLKFKLPFGAALTESPKGFKMFGETLQWEGVLNTDHEIEIPLKP